MIKILNFQVAQWRIVEGSRVFRFDKALQLNWTERNFRNVVAKDIRKIVINF